MNTDSSQDTATGRTGAGDQRPGIKIGLFWAIMVVFIFGLIEFAAFIGISNLVPTRIRQRLGLDLAHFGSTRFHSPADHTPHMLGDRRWTTRSTDTKRETPSMFHPKLGWDYPPFAEYRDLEGTLYRHDASGERRRSTRYDTTLIATYGDSFTYCSQVKDDETWQTFLAGKLGSNVLNFGVGGYGTDQAFLKYKWRVDSGAKIVMLGIFPENINRVVNIYRPFYALNAVMPLTKPRFALRKGRIRFIPNPTANAGQLPRLRDPKYLMKLGEMDYWYQFSRNHPPIGFPHIAALVRLRGPILDQVALSAAGIIPFVSARRYPWNLFDEPEPCAVMCRIVDLFVETARRRNAEPFVVLLPHRDYIRELQENKISRVSRLIEYLQDRNYQHIDVIEEMAEMATKDKLEAWYRGHATVEGNRVIAEILYRNLRRMGKAGK